MTPSANLLTSRSRPAFRALARSFVPEAGALDEAGWSSLEALVEGALATRPRRVRRQVILLLRVLDLLARLRFRRGLATLDARRLTRWLERLGTSRLLLLRRGVWGLRTLVLLGYYGDSGRATAVGYRADPAGWEARR